MSTGAVLQVDGLTRVFDVSQPWLTRTLEGTGRQTLWAVNDVSFSVNQGETFALVGESGCGKSTVARLVAGLIPITAGTVRFAGTDVSRPQSREALAARRRVQMIFQDPYSSLNPRWRVAAIIAEPLRALGLVEGNAAQAARVLELLTQVGLPHEAATKFPHAFSGGQRQRIAIARSLAAEPEVILCDEPTSALDVSVQAQILNLMRDLQRRLGLTYLFISHDMAVVRHMADTLGVMYLGRLVEMGPAERLFTTPQHPYTRALLSAVPKLEKAAAEAARQPIEGEVPDPINPPSGCVFHPRCPFVAERCKAERPQMRTLGNGVHVACHGVEEGRLPAMALAAG